MPDIRDILRGLDEQHQTLYSQVRTEMRRAYMGAHTATNGVARWNEEDDAFLDLIDIKIAKLFDRAGFFDAYADGARTPDTARELEIADQLERDHMKVVNKYAPKQTTMSQQALTEALKEGNAGQPWPNNGQVQ